MEICCKTKVNRTVYSCGLHNLLQNFVIELSKILRKMSLLSFDSLNQPLGFIALVVMKKDLYQPTITVTQDLLKFWSLNTELMNLSVKNKSLLAQNLVKVTSKEMRSHDSLNLCHRKENHTVEISDQFSLSLSCATN